MFAELKQGINFVNSMKGCQDKKAYLACWSFWFGSEIWLVALIIEGSNEIQKQTVQINGDRKKHNTFRSMVLDRLVDSRKAYISLCPKAVRKQQIMLHIIGQLPVTNTEA